jgi:hypothetical protein
VKELVSWSIDPNIFVRVMSASSSDSGVCGIEDERDEGLVGEEGVDLDARMLVCTPTVERAVILRTGEPSIEVKLPLWESAGPFDLVGEAFLVYLSWN